MFGEHLVLSLWYLYRCQASIAKALSTSLVHTIPTNSPSCWSPHPDRYAKWCCTGYCLLGILFSAASMPHNCLAPIILGFCVSQGTTSQKHYVPEWERWSLLCVDHRRPLTEKMLSAETCLLNRRLKIAIVRETLHQQYLLNNESQIFLQHLHPQGYGDSSRFPCHDDLLDKLWHLQHTPQPN